MQTTNFSISKTGTVGVLKTDVSTDTIGSSVIVEVSNSEKLSVQSAGTGSATVLCSNDGVNFVAYLRFMNPAGAGAAVLSSNFYVRPEGDHFAYLRFDIVGQDATFILTVRGLN